MSLLKLFLSVTVLLAACSGGASEPDATIVTADSSLAVVDATMLTDGGATSDGMPAQDGSTGFDGGIVFSDGGVISLDGGIIGLDSGIAPPDDGGLPAAAQCIEACAELSSCFGEGGQIGLCESACTEDVQDCSPEQLTEIESCNAAPAGLECVDLLSCLKAIACIEA